MPLWHVVDGRGWTLGRLASSVANVLAGKHTPVHVPSTVAADHVVVVNAAHIVLTGKKREQKVYRHHTGWPGGLKAIPIERHLERRPDLVVRKAVYGMLPKNSLRKDRMRYLHVYQDEEHPHVADVVASEAARAAVRSARAAADHKLTLSS